MTPDRLVVFRMSLSGSASSSTRSARFPVSTVPLSSSVPKNTATFRVPVSSA
jgi:hypothetical protein